MQSDKEQTINLKQKIMKKVNSYNIYDENHYGTVLYHAIASDEDEVKELAQESGIDIEGLTIDLERCNVKDELGRPYSPRIEDAQVY